MRRRRARRIDPVALDAERRAALEIIDPRSIRKLPPGPAPAERHVIHQNRSNQGSLRRPLKGRTR